MAELSTVARPYAEALFEAMRHNPDHLVMCASQLKDLAATEAVSAVKVAMADPKLGIVQRTEIFLSLIQPAPSDILKNFITLLIENDRLLLLSDVSVQFDALCDRLNGIAQANITSAFPMSEQQIFDLVQLLEPKFGLKLKPHVNIDASLIGGVRVQVGDQVLDTSVQAQLVRMRDTMAV